MGNAIVKTLKQIVALPDARGKHPCECGYPEMRCLPDGVFHCPACRAEVLPTSAQVLAIESTPPGFLGGVAEETVTHIHANAAERRLQSAGKEAESQGRDSY